MEESLELSRVYSKHKITNSFDLKPIVADVCNFV